MSLVTSRSVYVETGAYSIVGKTGTMAAGNYSATDLWKPDPLTYPQLLTASEGFIIRATVPATGTWQAAVAVEYRELRG